MTKFPTAMSLLALVVSIATGYYSCVSTKDVAKSQVIRESYQTFHELTRLQLENWQVSHMFALPAKYEEVSNQVASSFSSFEPAKKSEMVLKERAVADLIFNVYEEAFYQWSHAKEVGDTKRADFLEEVLNYLTGRLLRNPRLLYYWSEAGGGLSSSYEETTIRHYEDQVLHNSKKPLQQNPDSRGPFVIERVANKTQALK